MTLADYTEEILASGLPGLRPLSGRSRRSQLDGYVNRIVDRDILTMREWSFEIPRH